MDDEGCGGTGVRLCLCGGDLCVCEANGEIECDGCPDCRPDDYWTAEEIEEAKAEGGRLWREITWE